MATIQEALARGLDYHRAGQLVEAAVLYRRILEADHHNADALHLLGLIARHGGLLDRALSLIRQAIALNPTLIDAHFNLGNILRGANRPDEAVAAWYNGMLVAPDDARFYYSLGNLLYCQDSSAKLGRALTCLQRAIVLTPAWAEAHQDLGGTLQRAERLDEGIASLRRALALRPDLLSARMMLGSALLSRGDRVEARSWLEAALVLDPSKAVTWYNLGCTHYASGACLEALACFRRAALLGITAAATRVGAVLISLNRHAEAEAELLAALPLPGADVPDSIELLAKLLIREQRLSEARALFSRLATTPLAGVSYAGECLTALAALDLHENKPQAAAARLAPVRGDNCRFFTVKSLAAFRLTLAGLGLQDSLERPANPDPRRPRVTSSSLASHGRFAHNVLEYILIRLYAETFGYTLETPDWVGGWFFDLDDPPQSGPLAPLEFGRWIINDLVSGNTDRRPIANCDILSPLFLLQHREIYRARVQSWLKPRPVWRPFLEPAIEQLRRKGNTVVAIHIRRGDFVQFNYPITETAWYVDWLRELWPQLDRPVLYLASDDLVSVRSDFSEFQPCCSADLIEPWPGLEYLQDFHVLMQADVVGISAASGYSMLAARLNQRARLCVEPNMSARRICSFRPWSP